MKHINSFAALCGLMAIFAAIPSCQKEALNSDAEDQIPAGYQKVTLSASIEDTKINGDKNGGIQWNTGEESISVLYMKGEVWQPVAQFKKTTNTSVAPTGTFEGTVAEGDDLLFKYAVFPYNNSHNIASGKIKVNMSKSQSPVNESGLTSNSILAGKISGTTVTLSPTCGYMKINLPVTGVSSDGKRKTTDIKTIVIKGTRTSDEDASTSSYMSGTCYISFDSEGNPSLTPRIAAGYNYDSIELHPKSATVTGTGTVYCGGTVFCPILPGTYNYLSFELKDLSDNTVGSFEVNSTNTFKRGLAKDLGTFYYPYIKTGTIGTSTFGTRTLSAAYDMEGNLTLTGSADAFTGHPATLASYEFGFEAWAGDTQLDDIVCTAAEAKNGGESVDFTSVSTTASVTKVKAYAKVGTDGTKVYGEEMTVTVPKSIRTVTFNFTDGLYTAEAFTKETYSFVYDTPAVGDYKCIDDKGDKSDAFPTLNYTYKPARAAQIKKWDGSAWVTDAEVTTSTDTKMLGGSLTRVQDGVSYTLHFPKGGYTRTASNVDGKKEMLLMVETNYSIELPAFTGFKLTKVICSNPSTSKFFARVVNDPSTAVGSGNGATVVNSTGNWEDIFKTAVPIETAATGTVQYLKINTQCRMPYLTLEYTEE